MRVFGLVGVVMVLGFVGASWQRWFPRSTQGKTVITMWLPGWMASSESLRESMDSFEATHEKLVVELRPLRPADLDRLEAGWRSGKRRGDIVLAPSGRARQWAAEGLLAEWQDFFDMQFPADGFIPAFLQAGQVQGKQYLLPVLGHPVLVAVRRGMPAYRGLAQADKQLVVDRNSLPEAAQAVALALGKPAAEAKAWCRRREGARGGYLLTVYPGPGRLALDPELKWLAPEPGRPVPASVEGFVIPRCNAHYALSRELVRDYLMSADLYREARWCHGLPTIQAHYRQAGEDHPGPLLEVMKQSLPAAQPTASATPQG